MLKEYKTVSEISGPLMMVEGVENAKFGHMVDIELGDGTMRHGQILQVQVTGTIMVESRYFRSLFKMDGVLFK